VFGIAMAIDNFSAGFAGIALIAYMSSLTNVGYTATQYALLSSFYALLGKVMKGFSGVIVETLAQTRPLMEAYALFFAGTAALALPAIALVAWLARHAPAGVSSKA
jgi:PAT family beta-lactamase induction signal transducer AmpG